MTACWILIADAGRARILRADSPLAGLEEVEDLIEPVTRQPGHEVARDAPGHAMNRARGERTAFEPRQEPHEQAAIEFAHTLAGHLAEGHRSDGFQRLYLVAPPKFLGHLRASLPAALRACVAGEVGKDLSRMPIADIRSHLPKRL